MNSDVILRDGLVNSDIVFVTAHPDDESMFFTPSIIELGKANYNNTLRLICFSNGNYDGLGPVREHELRRATQILNFTSVKILDYEDNITRTWDKDDIAKSLDTELKGITGKLTLVTFDERGISGHPNHFSLYHGALQYAKTTKAKLFKLKSWPLYEKYSGFLWVNLQLFWKYLKEYGFVKNAQDLYNKLTDGTTSWDKSSSTGINIYGNFNSWFLGLSTMTYAHYSQIVWFRWFWIFLSKYMNSNELVAVSLEA